MRPRLAPALLAVCAVVLLVAFSASGWARDVVIPIPNVRMVFSHSTTPKKLSRVEATPIALDIRAGIQTLDGSRPPALKRFVLDLDRQIAVDARGLPVCEGGRRDIRSSELPSRCKDAIVGRGKVGVQIQFPEQPPIATASKLTVLNGGDRGVGKTTLYAVAYLVEPIVTSFMMAIVIKKHPHGYRAVVEVPKLANGAGSLTHLSAELKRRFTRDGEVVDFLTASCPNGKLQSQARALFEDGTTLHVTALQTCVPSSS